jgi:hypothetical protein
MLFCAERDAHERSLGALMVPELPATVPRGAQAQRPGDARRALAADVMKRRARAARRLTDAPMKSTYQSERPRMRVAR